MTDREALLMRLMEVMPAVPAGTAELPEDLQSALAQDAGLRKEAAFMRRLCQSLRTAGGDAMQQTPPEHVRRRTLEMLQDPDQLLCETAAFALRRHEHLADAVMLAGASGELDEGQVRELAKWTGEGELTCLDCALRYEAALRMVQHHRRTSMAAATAETRPAEEAVEVRCRGDWHVRVEPHALSDDAVVVNVYPPPGAPAEPRPRLLVGLQPEASRPADWVARCALFPLEAVLTPRGEALFAALSGLTMGQIAMVGLSFTAGHTG